MKSILNKAHGVLLRYMGAAGLILYCCDDNDEAANEGLNAAALQQAALSREQLDWAKKVYAESAPDRAAAVRRANEVSDAQLGSMRQNDAIAKDYNDYAKTTYRPLEQKMVADAQAYDTPGRQEQNAGKAVADVGQQFDNTAAQSTRALSRMGVNPNSGMALAASNQAGMAKAVATAAAANKARTDTEMQGYARKSDAANLGRNLSSAQATSAGVAMNAGNSAVNNAQAVGSIQAGGNAIMQTGYSGAVSANSSAGNLYGQSAQLQNQKRAQEMQMMSDLGGSGTAVMMASDVRLKTDIKGMNPEAALKAINKTPVSKWKYRSDSAANDGGIEHTGPMAQDVNATMGDEAAPNGTAIDLITMNGMTMAAIQALSKKVDRLAGPRGMRGAA